jgi:hypothetical protein
MLAEPESGSAFADERAARDEALLLLLDHVFDGLVARPTVTTGPTRSRDLHARRRSSVDGFGYFPVGNGVTDANEHLALTIMKTAFKCKEEVCDRAESAVNLLR